jgi:hypothetical protein
MTTLRKKEGGKIGRMEGFFLIGLRRKSNARLASSCTVSLERSDHELNLPALLVGING